MISPLNQYCELYAITLLWSSGFIACEFTQERLTHDQDGDGQCSGQFIRLLFVYTHDSPSQIGFLNLDCIRHWMEDQGMWMVSQQTPDHRLRSVRQGE
ncbi:MAG: hypothetical protein J07HQW1_02092 [Haloquadratum walsbyi J07HQW1]|uniref:Uncharacterized protein n=1 Tax=Haloquadratum walsbyi J07HQW1 TaxID=1238424 RepID=U1PEL1_9EURY|nr:MAG: hypothetical protein J07HQW1_02092 [Haloquadratum walsbyi J07HQW1]